MTLQQLKYVIVIADSGSVNSAAKNLYLSQPVQRRERSGGGDRL